jgi:hypothetical protein
MGWPIILKIAHAVKAGIDKDKELAGICSLESRTAAKS